MGPGGNLTGDLMDSFLGAQSGKSGGKGFGGPSGGFFDQTPKGYGGKGSKGDERDFGFGKGGIS